jgi:hypothetical protein
MDSNNNKHLITQPFNHLTSSEISVARPPAPQLSPQLPQQGIYNMAYDPEGKAIQGDFLFLQKALLFA